MKTDTSIRKFLESHSHWTIRRSSEVLDIKTPKLYRLCYKYNIPFAVDKLLTNRRKYHLNHNYFSTWTPNAAYMAGFIAADGYITANYKVLKIQVAIKDIKLIERFKKELQSNAPIKEIDNHGHPAVVFIINSTVICKDLLKKYRITNKKSLTLKFPKSLPDNILKHFIRGYLDGDGCVYTHHDNKYMMMFLCGTKPFLLDIKKNVKRILTIKTGCLSSHQRTPEIYKLEYYGINARKILKWLYTCANIKLNRKYKKYQDHINNYKQNESIRINNKSGHIGVSFQNKGKLWIARIHVGDKEIYLGCSKNKKKAIKLRKIAENKFHKLGLFRPLY